MTATPQFDETPQGYLAEADKHFDAGDRFEGSKYVWLATQAAIAAFAERRGLPCGNDDEAFEVILTLELQNGRDYDHTGAYGIAQGFRDNSRKPGKYDTSLDLNHWDEQGFALRRPIAAEFVNYIVEKTPTKGAIPQGRKTPREYLYEAEKRFYAGDKKEGSKYTWLATLTAIAAIAEQRGLPCRNYDEARNVVRALKDGGTPLWNTVAVCRWPRASSTMPRFPATRSMTSPSITGMMKSSPLIGQRQRNSSTI